MSDTASPHISVRAALRDLREIPLDTETAMSARLALTPRELGVWFSLRTHLWIFGDLPVSVRALAKIAGIGPKSFETMMPVLAPFFDRFDDGRWRDVDLEDERSLRLDLDPTQSVPGFVPRKINPAVSDARRRAGKEGAKRRWDEERRKGFHLIDGGREEGAIVSTDAPGMANGMANEMANPIDLPSTFAAGLASGAMPFATAGASPSPGPSDRLFSLEIQEKIEETDGRTRAGDASATDGKISGTDDGKRVDLDGKTPAPFPAGTDGKRLGDRYGKSASEPARSVEPLPYTVAESFDVPSAAPQIGADAIIAALRTASGGKITPSLLTASGIAPIRALLDLGCDFDRDVLPAVRATIPGLSEPLRSLGASFLREASIANRDVGRRTAAKDAARERTLASQVFVIADSPQWNAWLAHHGKTSFSKSQQDRGGPYGWYFPSEWPPGVDAEIYARRSARAP